MPLDQAGLALTVAGCGGLGLLIGSFLNVVIYRMPRRMSIVRPASRCPRCEAPLSGWENIPVASWLVLRGKCRHCANPISPRYPIVELLTAATFVVLARVVGPAAPLAPLLVVIASTLAASVIDLDQLALPLMVIVADLVGAAGLLVISLVEHGGGRLAWGWVGAGATVVAGLMATRWLSPRGRPAIVMGVLGWCAGWLWPPGGLVVAGWVIIAAAIPLIIRVTAEHRTGVRDATAGVDDMPDPSSLRTEEFTVKLATVTSHVVSPPLPGVLAVASLGAFGALVVGAVLRGH